MTKNTEFTLSLIVAIAENGVIGHKNQLPWRLGSDLRRFRKLTMGHPLIMGRKTFEAIGKPLDGRDSIVVSRNNPSLALNPHVFSAASLEEALTTARKLAKARGVKEAFVIGGAELFKAALPIREPDLSDARARATRRRCTLGTATFQRLDRDPSKRVSSKRSRRVPCHRCNLGARKGSLTAPSPRSICRDTSGSGAFIILYYEC